MKIVFIIPKLIKSGPVSVLYNIIHNLDRSKYSIDIIRLRKNTPAFRTNEKQFEDLGVNIYRYSYSLFQLEVLAKSIAHKLEMQYRNENVIFHAHGYFPVRIVSYIHSHPTLCTVHNNCEEDFLFNYGYIKATYMIKRYYKGLDRISHVIYISNNMMQRYQRKLMKDNASVIYNGVDAIHNDPNLNIVEIKKQLDIPASAKIILCSGAFTVRKNQKRVIQELKNCKQRNFIVLFAGMGALEEECKRYAAGDSRFRFLGYVKDMTKYWAIADLFISASLSEGLPMAVLEVLIQGIPCILSNIPSHIEIAKKIWDDDRFCFNLNETGSLSAIVDDAWNTPYEKEKIKCRAYQYFSAHVMGQNYMNIYRQINQNKCI